MDITKTKVGNIKALYHYLQSIKNKNVTQIKTD